MITAGFSNWILNALNVTIHIRDVCVFLAPTFSSLTSISTFLPTGELWSQGAGLSDACFTAFMGGYSSQSVTGSFDNESMTMFSLQFTYYLWGKLLKLNLFFGQCCCLISILSLLVSAWGVYYQPFPTVCICDAEIQQKSLHSI